MHFKVMHHLLLRQNLKKEVIREKKRVDLNTRLKAGVYKCMMISGHIWALSGVQE